MIIYILSMGCPKNTADSEHLKARLQECGHKFVRYPDTAECVIINTCGFIQDAVKENIDAILDLEVMKKKGRIKTLIVAGCLVNRYEKELRRDFADTVDLFVRSEEWDKVTEFLGGKSNPDCLPVPVKVNYWTRYIKISEGCNTRCSYCAIPMIRGSLRSVPMKRVIDEARVMCAAGAKELCLVGQDLTVYGQDFGDGTDLRTLLRELNDAVPKGTWIRLMYLHPNRVNEELIDFIMSQDKILHYLDIPIQHSDPKILSLMNRPCPEGHMKRIFSYIRELDPLFALRTTVMVGFPGEDAVSFKHLMDFVNDIEFDWLGTFIYSREEGTKAFDFSGRVRKKAAVLRYNTLRDLQEEISIERGELFYGRELDVIVEEVNPYEPSDEYDIAWGRSYRHSPEIDGIISLGSDKDLHAGDIVRAEVKSGLGEIMKAKVLSIIG